MAPATYDPRIHHRRTIRLSGWDYSAAGSYFVTVCANSRACLFGEIIGGRMRPNEVGAVVVETWRWLSTQYTYVVLDEWCVHAVSTKNINLLRDTPGAVVWQRSFWEHIVREAGEMDRIRDYIRENPARWAADPLNPHSVTSRISK
jgi:REP element-mobilizing transposase RayT